MEPNKTQKPESIDGGCLYCGEAADGCCCSSECLTAFEIENPDYGKRD